ncbi:ArgP/LysG family DNA-binding transcriptional regulator [Xylanimonas oleitrophica]|uniref:ArgP/LysG family DNA-binding transcriptional regulator n=1 Tax=Xylanimonas oleitrophica TaxID=2607479 RepID=A0A2W5WVD4_9MICO|nr:LysR family transcriptional regulator ArgP [Xylanimonas oleitrophica]PZR52236.1 ArgP/LysG family DNA-binding transcriptional regulator [Xylanimonas oleitrophica]
MELAQLEALVAVVDEGSFDAAARLLHVTPSAVSQRIKALETAAGTVLLRRTRPVAATAAGVDVVRSARQVLAVVRESGLPRVRSEASDLPRVPLAINGDSLNTWALRALATVGHLAVFDVHREDQDHSAELLRQGEVMAAVTTQATPVQGCAAVRLGVMRYRPFATPAFAERWFSAGLTTEALAQAPVMMFDRKDDLQDRYLREQAGAAVEPPRHYVPSSADYARAIRLGIGWGLLPAEHSEAAEAAGELVDLAPGSHVDVELHWQQWSLRTPVLDAVAQAVREAAREALLP